MNKLMFVVRLRAQLMGFDFLITGTGQVKNTNRTRFPYHNNDRKL